MQGLREHLSKGKHVGFIIYSQIVKCRWTILSTNLLFDGYFVSILRFKQTLPYMAVVA